MVEQDLALTEVVSRYMITIKGDERSTLQQELSRFVWWVGSQKTLGDLSAHLIESYQLQAEQAGADVNKRMEPVKLFLTFCQQEKLVSANLAKSVKLKRVPKSVKTRRSSAAKPVSEEPIQLTAEGYEQKKSELEQLISIERPKVSHDILEARRDKDIRENAAYDAAKQHQALVEARIRELEQVLGAAVVLGESPKYEKVTFGATVVLRNLDTQETARYTLVSPSEVNPRQGKISTVSPIGKALMEKLEGDTVEIEVPAGTIRYLIELVEA